MVSRAGEEPGPGPEPEPDAGRELALVDGAIALMIDVRVYRLGAVKKAAYRLADRCTAILGALDEPLLPVSLRFAPAISETAAREVARAFFQELLDQELREQIAEETSAIRTLILAAAFSKADLIKREP